MFLVKTQSPWQNQLIFQVSKKVVFNKSCSQSSVQMTCFWFFCCVHPFWLKKFVYIVRGQKIKKSQTCPVLSLLSRVFISGSRVFGNPVAHVRLIHGTFLFFVATKNLLHNFTFQYVILSNWYFKRSYIYKRHLNLCGQLIKLVQTVTSSEMHESWWVGSKTS